ncbi:hypothetical protein [Paludisphaera borealis]|nr:hypothetical protein [Paludisphaera borealis]
MFQTRTRRRLIPARLAFTAILTVGGGCSTFNGWPDPTSRREPVAPSLLQAEQRIDDLDRIMTANGTIGVKSPDVWGQDRLAKFRSEYETQMAQWLKVGFKGVINASISRNEADAKRVQLAAGLSDPTAKTTAATDDAAKSMLAALSSMGSSNSAATAAATATASPAPMERTATVLEPTVVLDEHSNYLNHLNQLRRINAGDDLTDRPGYGLYLVRIPVTLTPGPKSRRGRGAIITVSAKSLMVKDTLRYTLRNAVINETVGSLTQAICNDADKEGDPNSGPGMGPISLVAFADSEVYYGPENIVFLRKEAERQLAREFNDEPYHRSARVSEWLRGELEASYSLLEQSVAPPAVASGQSAERGDPLERIAALVVQRDFDGVAKLRQGGLGDSSVLLAGGAQASTPGDPLAVQRRKAVGLFGFALRIQAAALNARLKQDIVDQLPELKLEQLRNVNFFDPNATDDAIQLFGRYVNAKWPLRVYAIEPVIAQQNVADAVGRRSLSALDLLGGVPLGPFRAAGAFSTDRRISEDEAAIRLNPTMVGFGAGESTFGWIFYPRLQTTRTPYRSLSTAASRLIHAQLPQGDKEQSIEPGQRECTALIVMPNFIPKIEFVTVANWFRTGDLNERQASNIERSSDLASRLVEAEDVLNRVQSAGEFRPEELQIALERLNQLKSLMPTQRMVVRVPFTGDVNDSRIFCSRGGQLRPALLAWHGKPPEPGGEATIFLEGKNFSVHDTHVIAGGKPAESVLVSRNLMQVTIAKEALSTLNADGAPLMDVSVATPNGASNHLLIRMRPTQSQNAQLNTAARTPEAPKPELVGPPWPPSQTPPPPPSPDPAVVRASDAKPPADATKVQK